MYINNRHESFRDLLFCIRWPCPACGYGVLHDACAGRVPGDDCCDECGRFWTMSMADLGGDRVLVRWSIPRIARRDGDGTRPEWSWGKLPCDDDAWHDFCMRLGESRTVSRESWERNRQKGGN
jgi:hypothetical protein